MPERSSSDAGKGALVLVVGPSGAGKDSLIREARAALCGDAAFLFPRRLITRPSDATEECVSLTWEEFAQGRDKGAFAVKWEAHGHGYALDLGVIEAAAHGAVVVANVSRQIVARAQSVAPRTYVVLVTAGADALAERLRARGREPDIESRLVRAAYAMRQPPDLAIVNDGPLQRSAETFGAFLRAVAN